MKIDTSGYFLVQAGSKARIKTTSTVPRGVMALRNTLLETGVLLEDGDSLLFTSGYSFPSVSAAAAAVSGRSENGRTLWRLADGKTYADWEADQTSGGKPGADIHSG